MRAVAETKSESVCVQGESRSDAPHGFLRAAAAEAKLLKDRVVETQRNHKG